MIRPALLALLLLAAPACRADEVFPVIHNEPITVRLLDGKDGHPLAHQHLTFAGGYDLNDLRTRLWLEEATTDDHGEARLSAQMANLPWLQVDLLKGNLCLAKSSSSAFSIERIRRDGLTAPNRCSPFVAQSAPGVFVLFAKSKLPKKGSTAPQAAPTASGTNPTTRSDTR